MNEKTKFQQLTVNFFLQIIGWGFVLFLAIYFITRNALPHFSLDPDVHGHHWSHVGLLLTHITGGLIALLVGPIQFWSGLRNRNLRLHRFSGKIYLASVLVSVLSASYILTLPESSFGFRIGIAGLTFAWITTTGVAFIAIKRRMILQHKEWMIRSYLVTFGFVFFRVLSDFMFALDIASPGEIVSAVSWLCWALPLLLIELILQGKKILEEPNRVEGTARSL